MARKRRLHRRRDFPQAKNSFRRVSHCRIASDCEQRASRHGTKCFRQRRLLGRCCQVYLARVERAFGKAACFNTASAEYRCTRELSWIFRRYVQTHDDESKLRLHWTPILSYQCACVCLVVHRQSIVEKNRKSGFVGRDKAELKIDACAIKKNGSHGVALHDSSRATICRSRLLSNKGLVVKKESSGCSVTCSANVCTKSAAMSVAPPGFQFVSKS